MSKNTLSDVTFGLWTDRVCLPTPGLAQGIPINNNNNLYVEELSVSFRKFLEFHHKVQELVNTALASHVPSSVKRVIRAVILAAMHNRPVLAKPVATQSTS